MFPTLKGLIFPVTKTPIWSTKIQTATSGKETRLAFWSYPIWKYSIGFDILQSNAVGDLQTLAGFYLARQGSYDSFLFTDPDDNAVTALQFGTGNGVTTSFQLLRTLGGYAEPVQALNGAASIFNAGALQTVTTNYTISATGLVTFVTAPLAGNVLTWTGSFYWRCRFLSDSIDLNKFMKDLWELQNLSFQSVK